MPTFGKPPSSAPTFGPSEGSLGSVGDIISIHADLGGALSKIAVPLVSSARAESSSQAAVQDPPSTAAVHDHSWAVAQAVTVAAALDSVGAMAADEARALHEVAQYKKCELRLRTSSSES